MLSDYPEIELATPITVPSVQDEAATKTDMHIEKVQLDGLVVLKILKHSHENLPQLVTGQLLGLGLQNTLEVTNCFPFIHRPDTEEVTKEDESADENYQLDMMKKLRDVNVDCFTVGWYAVSWQESYLNNTFIETMHVYQEELREHSVCIIYDPLRTSQGKLYMKALRLKKQFTDMFAYNQEKQDFSQSKINEHMITSMDIFQEVPITINNNHLIDAFLWELGQSSCFTRGVTSFQNVVAEDRDTSTYQVKTTAALLEATDNICGELQKYQTLTRRRPPGEEAPQVWGKPSRLETLFLINQLNHLANHLQDVSHQCFESIALCESIQAAQTLAS
eukprot:TRINITY_DN22066_c0_g1_i1.p1 TRINITY_DN22066_c0_g1~~TRINITY_DN22066_c0_g1_i1.p1  ORF type:complete len:334 (+),score=157.27 TRINITY_DN22066_c0_g1_i1:87-1088(+)